MAATQSLRVFLVLLALQVCLLLAMMSSTSMVQARPNPGEDDSPPAICCILNPACCVANDAKPPVAITGKA
ncbi:hypothetical protein BRADI_3g32462v3 [Brachypodium distachyon]|uniref:Uncharacterized protein n=1 Tax=Brachypodium distachyon TaxID=15368 RepID=I1I5U6_BRADI|nr:hypothetical protein BRADI_3g32462v3 [Brachypodium distachyon]